MVEGVFDTLTVEQKTAYATAFISSLPTLSTVSLSEPEYSLD
jgi:hypothetical protein